MAGRRETAAMFRRRGLGRYLLVAVALVLVTQLSGLSFIGGPGKACFAPRSSSTSIAGGYQLVSAPARGVVVSRQVFGLGTTEILVILAVGAVVLGPEALKGFAKEAGKAAGDLKEVPKAFEEGMEIAQSEKAKDAEVVSKAKKNSLVVIAGPPAAGKGTQCENIKEKYGYVHISTGDILRDNVKNGTDLGLKAKTYMDKGELVPSELIVDLVKDRLEKDDVKEKGCLLDGFPRAPDQAQAMVDAKLSVDQFILIEVPDEILVERGCGRRLDPKTGDIYHLKFKPPPADIVDRLVHRSDDQEDKIRNRLEAYHSQIDGILPFFKKVVTKVDGTPKPSEVWTAVQKTLD